MMASIGIWLFVIILAAVALLLLAGGAVLVGLGGSPYYLVTGLMLLGSAASLARRGGLSIKLYGAMLVFTLAWSLGEAGLDGWALAPRLLGPAMLGMMMLALPTQRLAGKPGRWWLGAPALACFGAIALGGVLAVAGEPGISPGTEPAGTTRDPIEWRAWGGATGGGRYSPANQITPENAASLELAWRHDTRPTPPLAASFEATPLAVGDRLFTCPRTGSVVALDQVSGREIWRYDTPAIDSYDYNRVFGAKCRGVTFFAAPRELPACTRRILFASPDGYLRAIDAANGKPCPDFGKNGAADLHEGMEGQLPGSRLAIEALPSSPPPIINGVAVVGQSVSDLGSLNAPTGVIRGFDALSGKLLWAWSAGMEADASSGPAGAYVPASPNAWGPLSGDEDLGLVYVPLGNSLPDYFGGMRRKELDSFATAVVALDAKTGQRRWHFQTVHHDLWDYDLAAQPTVADLPGPDGKLRKALLVATKTGQIFVLDRATGKPIDPVEERPVPQGAVKGDWTSPTQPFTTGFPQLAGDDLTEKDMWGITPLDQMWCRITFLQSRYAGRYTPITQQRTLMFPGTAGGINWGSVSIDAARALLVVNTLHFANFGRLVPREDVKGQAFGGAKGEVLFGMEGTPWVFAQSTFTSPLGVPCQKPPFGKIHALDLRTRKPVWSNSFGTAEWAGPFNIPTRLPIRMGVPNMGGSIVTAGGVTFIGAAQDRRFRAYDTATGRELWSHELPAIAAATPMTYVSPTDGRQYVVIASGGHFALPGPGAGAIMAFALPRK